MSDSNFKPMTQYWGVFRKCHYILSHSFKIKKKRRHNGHTDWKRVRTDAKKKSEGEREQTEKPVSKWWDESPDTHGDQVKFSGTSGSFWRFGVKVYHHFLLDFTEKRLIRCVTGSLVTKYIHTLFSHHALGSFNWRSQKSRIQGCFNCCSKMQRDIGEGTLPKK